MALKEKNTPSVFDNISQWETNRRKFLRATLIAGAASQIAWFTSCSKQLEEANEYLTAEQSTLLKAVLLHIFPDDGNGPSADDLNTFGYILWVLSDQYLPQDEKDFIIEGLDWSNEQAKELYAESFIDLESNQQESLLQLFVDHKYGKKWMNVMVSLTLESLLLDPIYGGNVNEAGWSWLEHVPGVPRPTEQTTFNAIMAKHKPTVV